MEDPEANTGNPVPVTALIRSQDIFTETDYEEMLEHSLTNGLGHANQYRPKPMALKAGTWANQPIVHSEQVIKGLFDISDKVVIVGQSKTRKSFFALQLGLNISLGRSFVNFEPTKPKRVLLIQFEIKQERYQYRINRMANKLNCLNVPQLNNLSIINARGFGETVEDLKFFIKEKVNELKPEVLILDPLYKLILGDESKSEEIKPILKFFDNLAESHNAAIIYVHHDKKGVAGDQQTVDRGAGSGVLARDFDAAIYLTPQESEKDTLVVDFISRNYPPIEPLTVEWMEGAFNISSAPAIKQTTKSNVNKKPKSSELVTRAKDWISKTALLSPVSMGMGLFNSKMEDLGIHSKVVSGVKEQLQLDSFLKIEKQKAGPGQPSLIVTISNPANRVDFKAEAHDYEEN